MMAYPEFLQPFNDEIYSVRISIRKWLIKVVINEIYDKKSGPSLPIYVRGAMAACPLPHNDAYGRELTAIPNTCLRYFSLVEVSKLQ